MHPILFKIGQISIYTYGFFIAMGFLTGILLAKREALRVGEDPEKVMDLAFYILIAAIVGSRLFYVVTNPKAFLTDPLEVFRIWNGGLVFYGGFIFAGIAALIYFKKRKLHLCKTADILAPSLAIGHFLGRLGCFFAGCCYGKVCNLPWAVTFTHPDSLAPLGVSLHPTQLYSAVNNLVIFGLVWLLRHFKKFDGQIFWTYVLLYGITRSFIEMFRGDFRGSLVFETLSVSQAIGGTLSILAAFMIVYLGRRTQSPCSKPQRPDTH